MSQSNSGSSNFFRDSAIEFQRMIKQLDVCPNCQSILVPLNGSSTYEDKFAQVLRCNKCYTAWGISDSSFTNLSDLIDLKADDDVLIPLKKHLNKVSQSLKRHLN